MKPALRKWTQEPEGIRAMTYNVLAQSLVRRSRFPNSGKALRMGTRQPALIEEVRHYRPQLLCMQELDAAQSELWCEQLKSINLEARYFKQEGKTHGLLLSWDSTIFEATSAEKVDYGDTSSGIPEQYPTGNIGAVVRLVHLPSKEPLVLATTHLYWRPEANYERLRQIVLLFEKIKAVSAGDKRLRVVLGADTNSAPWSPVYQYVLHGGVTEQMREHVLQSAAKEPVDVDSLLKRASDPNGAVAVAKALQSAHSAVTGSEPPFTNWTPDFKDTLDYIFVTGFKVTAAVEAVPFDEEKLDIGMPFQYEGSEEGHPSDHIPIVVSLELD